MTRRFVLAAGAAAALGLVPAAATAQTIEQRVSAAPAGTVRMSFTARPGVCGNGENVVSTRPDRHWESACEEGPVRVVLTVHGERVTALRTYVGGRWRPAGAEPVTDLGTVAAAHAAAFLIGLAERADGAVGKRAILPATLADSVEVWPDLLRIARDDARPRETRKAAVFWVGQAAGAAATQGLESLVGQETGELAIRQHAVFALSQRPPDEGVPALIRVARESPEPSIRKRALFWLAQSGDPRALALFEELLTRR